MEYFTLWNFKLLKCKKHFSLQDISKLSFSNTNFIVTELYIKYFLICLIDKNVEIGGEQSTRTKDPTPRRALYVCTNETENSCVYRYMSHIIYVHADFVWLDRAGVQFL